MTNDDKQIRTELKLFWDLHVAGKVTNLENFLALSDKEKATMLIEAYGDDGTLKKIKVPEPESELHALKMIEVAWDFLKHQDRHWKEI